MCTYIHTYMHAYIHTYIHACIHTYIHTYIHEYIHTQDGCEYLYQSNDDVQFISDGWTDTFVSVLKSSPVAPNYGVVGALDINNPLVLTQSMVHRTHQV